jgi:hypothetical protein
VASLLIKALEDLGWLIRDRCGGRLSIVMDDCGGQNKNKMVLRLAVYLVEMNYFKQVEFFFARGHTKNVCDQLVMFFDYDDMLNNFTNHLKVEPLK